MDETIEQEIINNTEIFVLQELESNTGKWISGGNLARQAKVSRNTIWRAIKKLQTAGYSIQSVTGRGYQLQQEQDQLSATGISLKLNNPDAYKLRFLILLIPQTIFSKQKRVEMQFQGH